jgi:hypothetical protein
MNIGEELVGDYLRHIKKCEFIEKNLYTEDVQGEIDVVGIDLKSQTVYVCEVAIHLITGLQYTLGSKPNNENKLVEKFSKAIDYAKKFFPVSSGYKHHFMLWSPIVKDSSEKAKNNQFNAVKTAQAIIQSKYNEGIELVINEDFLLRLQELRQYAITTTKEIKSPVVRLYQIEDKTKKYVQSKTYLQRQKQRNGVTN